MHKSRLAGFIVDGNPEDLRGGVMFWAAAPGAPVPGANKPE